MKNFGEMRGESDAMIRAFDLLRRVAPADLSVIVRGETGTGKELAARALHTEGARPSGPFVVVDCGAIQANLVESELFGHERAAFTGADRMRRGAFELASGGTVFLDEVGELPMELQPKLLRVLERREVQRVGGSKPLAVDVRVVAATHRNLPEMVRAGTFREDLFFRLAEFEIVLPPLREREADITMLAEHFLKELASSGGPEATLDESAKIALLSNPWRGNVRELRNALRRAAVLAQDNTVSEDDLMVLNSQLRPSSAPSGPVASLDVDAAVPIKEAREKWNAPLEAQYLRQVMKRFSGNLDEAARHAGLHRKSLQRLLRGHKIELSDFES